MSNSAIEFRDDRVAWAALGALLLGYVLVYLTWYPPISGVEDEIGFINQARVWSLGGVSSEGAGLPFAPHDFIEVDGRHVAARHPGRSLVALPFLVLGGGRAVFLSGMLLHVLTTLAAGALLVRLGRAPLWAALVLFHPTLAIYSRTVMADASAGAGLLLSALAILRNAPLGAGLAVGLAAAMRYHAGMTLPLVAFTFVHPTMEGTPRAARWRAALRCLVAGAFAGGVLVGYNLFVYGSANDPFTSKRGHFAVDYLIPQSSFYAASLGLVWPGLILAPLLDRARLRWLQRGLGVIFLGPLLFYYFHDRGSSWVETLILGQRLIQVALPLWIVAYAGLVDDWVATPLRRLLSRRGWHALVAVGCVALLGANALASAKHQRHLDVLASARDALMARVPPGALVVYNGQLYKLALDRDGVQRYRLLQLESAGLPVYHPPDFLARLDREPMPWYLVALHKTPGEPLSAYFQEVIDRYRMQPIDSGSSWLTIHATPPGNQP